MNAPCGLGAGWPATLQASGTFQTIRGTFMHSRTLGLLAFLLAGGWALAQAPAPVVNPAGAVPGGGSYTPAPMFTTHNGSSSALPAEALAGNGNGNGNGFIFYAGADYLLWQVRKGSIPLTASTIPVGLIALDVSDLFSFS